MALLRPLSRACTWAAFTVSVNACAAPSNAASTMKGGTLVPESPRLELGTIDVHQPRSAVFRVTNRARVPVWLHHVHSSRFCSGVIRERRLGPGAQGDIEITCKSDVQGPLREQLSLYAGDSPEPQVVFDIVGRVVPLLAFELPSVHVQLPLGESRLVEVALVGNLADAASLLPVPNATAAAADGIEMKVIPKGVTLRFDATKVGNTAGQLLFTTGVQAVASLTLPWSRAVRGSLHVTPSNPYFDLKLPGPKQVVLELTSSQPGFRVVATRVIRGPFEARLEPLGASKKQRIRVRLREERCAENVTGVQGTLLVVSNDRSEPEKLVPLLGLGRLSSP